MPLFLCLRGIKNDFSAFKTLKQYNRLFYILKINFKRVFIKSSILLLLILKNGLQAILQGNLWELKAFKTKE